MTAAPAEFGSSPYPLSERRHLLPTPVLDPTRISEVCEIRRVRSPRQMGNGARLCVIRLSHRLAQQANPGDGGNGERSTSAGSQLIAEHGVIDVHADDWYMRPLALRRQATITETFGFIVDRP